jgi:hypothetical protein
MLRRFGARAAWSRAAMQTLVTTLARAFGGGVTVPTNKLPRYRPLALTPRAWL